MCKLQRLDTNKFDDTVEASLGSSCPISIDGDNTINDIAVSFYFKLPRYGVPGDVLVQLLAGLYVDNTAMWSTYYNVTTGTAAVDGIVAWDEAQTLTKPYLTVRKIHELEAFESVFGLRYTIKINRLTRGTLDFKVRVPRMFDDDPSQDPKYGKFCSMRVTKVGRNLGCTKSPEEYTRLNITYDNIISPVGRTSWYSAGGTRQPREGRLLLEGLTNYGSDDLKSDMYADDDSIEVVAFFWYGRIWGLTIASELNGDIQSVKVDSHGYMKDQTEDLDFEFVQIKSESINTMNNLVAKTIGIEIVVPTSLNGPFKVTFKAKDNSEKITPCGLYITRVGKNIPCLAKLYRPVLTAEYEANGESNMHHLQFYTDKHEPEAYAIGDEGLSLEMEMCHYQWSKDPKESTVLAEFTFKANSNAAIGDEITIEAEIERLSSRQHLIGEQYSERVEAPEFKVSKELSVTISQADPSAILSNTTTHYAEVMANDSYVGAGKMLKILFHT